MPSVNHKKIAKNTLTLYFRMFLVSAVGLYSVRVVLNTLGVNDYGTYHAVAGLVALCAFLPGTLASATQRFFSFALGENDLDKLKKLFTVSWVLYGIIALVAVLILESVGIWFVNEHLRVPPDRLAAAQRLYHFSVLTFVAGIFTSPFNAIIIAHEDMQLYAYISISDACLKLGSVLLLAQLPWDKLELYGALLLMIAIFNALLYIGICVKRYEECQFKAFHWDTQLLRESIGFTGWTLFGQISTIARTQAVTLLLNQAFSPAVVAARAIAMTVASHVNVFSTNFNTSLYPPIIKAWAAGNKDEMFSLVFNGSKLTFFLLWILALPLLIEMDTVLGLWLQTPPAYAVLFTRLALVEALISSLSLPLMTAARAPGNVGFYELTLGSVQLAILLASFAALRWGAPPESVFLIAIAANILMLFMRLYIVQGLTSLSAKLYLVRVLVPACFVMLISSAMSLAAASFLTGRWSFVASSALTVLFTGGCIYFVGLDRQWRIKIRNMMRERLGRR
jgi:O-antigen/teichoic acid export membrane protein